MLELTTLKFSVDTSELDDAVTKIDALTTATKRFEKGTDALGTAGEKLNASTRRVNKGTEEVGTNISSLDKLLQKLNNQYGDLVSGFTKGESAILQQARNFGAAEKSLEPFIDILTRIKELTKDPFDQSIGSIRSITAEFERLTDRANLMAKGISLTTNQLREYSRLSAEVKGEVFKMGMDPSQGEGLQTYNKLLAEIQRKYLDTAKAVNKLEAEEKIRNATLRESEALSAKINQELRKNAWSEYTKSLTETSQEIKLLNNYYRELEAESDKVQSANMKIAASIERLEETSRLIRSGMSATEAARRVELKQLQIEEGLIDKLVVAERDLAEAKKSTSANLGTSTTRMSESAKAAAYLEKEMRRVEYALRDTNKELQVSNSTRLLKFEEALKSAGITGAAAEAQLENYRQSLSSMQNKMKRDMEAKLRDLSRAVSVQMGDVAVSLASGMNPFTVMIQQGDQLRAAFQMVDVDTKTMQKSMMTAAKMIATSFADTAKSMGVFFVGAIQAVTEQMYKLTLGPFVTFFKELNNQAYIGKDAFERFGYAIGSAFASFKTAFVSALPALIGSVAIATALLTAEAYKAAKAEDELSRSLILSGASLGSNRDIVIDYANTLQGFSSAKVLDVFAALAKEGKVFREEAEKIVPVILDLQKYLGVSIEDSVKKFAELKKEPVNALFELAEKTGQVNTKILMQVDALEKLGLKQQAVSLAAAEWARVNTASVNSIQTELSDLGKLVIWVGEQYDTLRAKMQRLVRGTSPLEKAKEDLQQLNDEIASMQKFNIGGVLNAAIEYRQTQAKSKEEEIKNQTLLNDKKAKQAELDNKAVAAMRAISDQSEKSLNAQERFVAKTRELGQNLVAIAKAKGTSSPEYVKAQQEASMILGKLVEDYAKVKENKEKLTDAEKEAIRVDKLASTAVREMIAVQNSHLVSIHEISEAEKKYRDILNSPDYAKYSLSKKQLIAFEYEMARLVEEGVKAEKQKIESYRETNKVLSEREDALSKFWDKQVELTVAVSKESEALAFQSTLIGMNDIERKKAIKTKEAQLKLDKELAEIESAKDIDENEKTLAKEQAYKRFAEAVKNVNTEISIDLATKLQKELEDLQKGFADVITTALFDGADAGKKKLRDLITNELKKPFNIVIQAAIQSVSGSIVNSLVGSTLGSVAGSSASNGIAGSALGSILGSGATLTSMGQYFGTGFMNTIAGTGAGAGFAAGGAISGANGLAMQIGSIAPYAAAVYGIYKLVKKFDDSGTLHTGGSSKYSASGGLTVGMGVSGVGESQHAYSKQIESFTTDLTKNIVSILDSTAIAFGKTAGYEAAAGFADDTSKDGAWGAFIVKQLNNTLVEWGNADNDKWAGTGFADAEKGVEEYLNAVSKDVKNVILGMDLPSWAKDMLDKLGESPSLEKLAETVSNINSTQKAFEALGAAMPVFANLSGEAATSLMTASGGIQAFASNASAYYDNFYSEQEKLSYISKDLKKKFEELGVAMPVDRLAFRAEVEKAMAQGNEELAVKLLNLGSAFAKISPEITGTIEDTNVLSETLKNLQKDNANLNVELLRAQGKTTEANAAFKALATEGMTSAEIAAWELNQSLQQQIKDANIESDLRKQILQLQGDTNALRAAELASLSPVNQELQKLIWALEAQKEQEKAVAEAAAQAAAEQKKIEDSLKSLANENANLQIQMLQLQGKTTEANAAIRALAIDGMTSAEIAAWDLNQALRASIAEMQAAQQAAAEQAQKAASIASEKYNLETRLLQLQGNTAELRKRELEALDPTNRALLEAIWAQEQANADAEAKRKAEEEAAKLAQQAAEEAARAAERLKEAWQSVTDSIFEEVRRIRGLVNENAQSSYEILKVNFENTSLLAKSGNQEAARNLPELSRALLEMASTQAKSLIELRRIQMLTAASLEETGNSIVKQQGLSIPTFASGGSYSGGLALVGENGPELINFNSGGQIYNANKTASMLSSDTLISAVEKLNENIDGLRFEVRADVSHNAKTANILSKITPNGDSISVTTEDPIPVQVV